MTSVFEAYRGRRNDVATALRELERHASEVGASTLSQRIGKELVEKLDEDRFHLVVVGEFNRGKTTFVNALLGRDALPVGVTPTTAVIHHVRWAEQPSATLVRKDGSKEPLEFEKLDRFVVHAEGKGNGDLDEVVHHLEIGYPAELLRERIVLVDTPGVNDLNLQRADITYKYIPQADAVLFVIDAGQPLTESERIFIKEKLIGQSRDKIIFVVAKDDIWSDSERDEALGYIRSELGRLVEGPVLFPISARRALAGDRARSGMDPLVAHLSAFLAEERGRIVLDNALGEGLEAARALAHGIEARRRAARMTADEIERRIARIESDMEGRSRTVDERRGAIREETAAIRAWLRRDLDRFCDDVIRQLPTVVDSTSVDELRRHLPSFLEHTFVGWAESEAAEVARALEELAEKTVAIMRENAHDAAKKLSEGLDVPPPDMRVDTFGYDLGVAALFSVGLGLVFTNALLGTLMAGAAPLLAYYLRGRIEVQTKQKAKEQAAVALREAAAKVGPKIEAMVEEFAKRLDAWVIEAGKEVHREMLDVLTSARRERAAAAPDADRADMDCDALGKRLADIRERLLTMRTGLWGAKGGEAHGH
jgi:GTPase Era involved in 16S rRNA processing